MCLRELPCSQAAGPVRPKHLVATMKRSRLPCSQPPTISSVRPTVGEAAAQRVDVRRVEEGDAALGGPVHDGHRRRSRRTAARTSWCRGRAWRRAGRCGRVARGPSSPTVIPAVDRERSYSHCGRRVVLVRTGERSPAGAGLPGAAGAIGVHARHSGSRRRASPWPPRRGRRRRRAMPMRSSSAESERKATMTEQPITVSTLVTPIR